MRTKFTEQIAIPAGIQCEVKDHVLICKKGEHHSMRKIELFDTTISVKDNAIHIVSDRANRRIIASLRTFIAHIKNMFEGLENAFVYEMEICNVHFPMTVKVEGNHLVVTNFLGEKEKRIATILPSVHVEVKGQKVIISSNSIEAAGQTAANIEKATNVPKRDRRVFQDGIFITSKCGRAI